MIQRIDRLAQQGIRLYTVAQAGRLHYQVLWVWNSRLGCSVSGKMPNPQIVDVINAHSLGFPQEHFEGSKTSKI